jgi:hypothetical protein
MCFAVPDVLVRYSAGNYRADITCNESTGVIASTPYYLLIAYYEYTGARDSS